MSEKEIYHDIDVDNSVLVSFSFLSAVLKVHTFPNDDASSVPIDQKFSLNCKQLDHPYQDSVTNT